MKKWMTVHVANDYSKCLTTKIEKTMAIGIDETGLDNAIIIAAGVILPKNHDIAELPVDSKTLSEEDISRLAKTIQQKAVYIDAVYVMPEDVDHFGIEKCKLRCWKSIAKKYRDRFVDHKIIVDGEQKIGGYKNNQKAIAQAENKIAEVSAASIIAKHIENTLMKEAEELYPNFSFGKHKGHLTEQHLNEIHAFGLTPYHRKTAVNKAKTKNIVYAANFSKEKLQEMVLRVLEVNKLNEKVLNAWQKDFFNEQYKQLFTGKLLPTEKAQFYIKKNHDNVMKMGKKHNIDGWKIEINVQEYIFSMNVAYSKEEMLEMYRHMTPVIKKFPTVVNEWDLQFLRDLYKTIRDEGIVSKKQMQYLDIYYKKIVDMEKKKRYA